THWQANPLKRLKNRIFFHQDRWLKYERRMVQAVDFVIVSVLEMQERLRRECDISEAKTLLVSNTEYKGFHDRYPSLSKKEVLSGQHFNITYIGGIGPHRGVDTAIRAMEYIREEIPHARLNIIGPGSPSVLNALSEIVDALQLNHWVKFYGKVPFHHVSSYMMHSDVNIIPHNSNRQTEAVIPHKLFQSMLSGKPTLVSSCAPLRRVVKSCDGGWVFDADDPKSCAQQVVRIYNAKDDEMMRVERAKTASAGPLSWETTGELLSGFYQKLQP
ncbi:glycosyltransferase family 4 protein, partial [Flavobacteriales bacterium]|nr:glycosyltransferase family 4 protein [Flavobacteriales bacterium]